MRKIFLMLGLFIWCGQSFANIRISIDSPPVMLTGVPFEITLNLVDEAGQRILADTTLKITGVRHRAGEGLTVGDSAHFTKGRCILSEIVFNESGHHILSLPAVDWQTSLRIIPGWLSLLPPFLAILLALVLRQVLVALFVGVWIGATVISDYNPFYGFLSALSDYIAHAPADPDKMSILIFSLMLGGMVGVISKMGGTQGIVERLSRFANDTRRGQLVTWLMGVFIFFDDYANTLIVGSTMRPLTDRLKISREKLAYLVDSTAAPVANIAVISTWIGFEISLMGAAFAAIGVTENAYITFFSTIPYNFYPIFAIIIGLVISLSGRDFGPMLKAEIRARTTGDVLAPGARPISNLDTSEILADEHIKKKWYNAFIPVMVVILTTLAGLWFTGLASVHAKQVDTGDMEFIRYVSTVIGDADSYAVLMWASFLGGVVAIIMALAQKLLSLEAGISAWIGGIKAMLLAALILTMAWSIGNICTDMHTANYVIGLTSEFISAGMVPFLTFFTAAVISFATGTSWGVMAILMPIAIPMGYLLPHADPSFTAEQQHVIFLSTIASVLAGATFGDHCSPISDTTIMSSMASGSDHIDHVRTQLPYAILGGLMSLIFGYLPIGLGITDWVVLPAGILITVLFIILIGKKSEGQQNSATSDS
jgi:Na+/H+ antiporter NhaC